MNTHLLIDTARAMVADDRGLLAMDESHPTCNKRFAKLAIPQTVDARRAYRELIITTPSLGESISGVILYDETIRQQKKDGTPFIKVINDAGIIQQPALEIWKGDEANVKSAQQALLHRARCNRAARRGEYSTAMERT